MSDVFPFDYSALNKGDTVSQQTIERIYLVKQATDPDRYRRCMMQFAGEIEIERPDLLVRYDGNSIRIMNDDEACDVTMKRIANNVRSIARNARRRASIDRSNFTDEKRRIAEHRDGVATLLMVSTRKQLAKAEREKLILGSGSNSSDHLDDNEEDSSS